MGWRVLYIEWANSLTLNFDSVKIKSDDKDDVIIPLSDIHSIIIDNPKITLTVQLINKCAEYNINLVFCSINHMPNAIINPFSGHKQSSIGIRKQIAWQEEQKKKIHSIIIRNKIRNQRRLLEFFNKSEYVIEKLKKFEEEVVEGDEGNREGLSAKMYFNELFGSEFKRFKEDVLNAGLNYGYAILRSQISKTIIAKGLHPSFGIFHKGPENSFNLSDDIIEPFRPIIDAYCYKYLLEDKIFKRDARLGLVKVTTIYAVLGNEKQTLFNVISFYLDSIINSFETGELFKILDIRIPYEEI